MVVLHFPGLLHTDSYVFFISDPGVICCWGCYYSHFSNENAKAQSGSILLKIILLINGRTRIQIQSVYPPKQLLFNYPLVSEMAHKLGLQEWKSLHVLQSNKAELWRVMMREYSHLFFSLIFCNSSNF